MSAVKQSEPWPTNKSPEMDIDGNVREMKLLVLISVKPPKVVMKRRPPIFATLLGRVSEASSHEIENLIGELRGLREKLKTDCDHLQGDIAEYAKLGQGVMQLAAIISDGMKELPGGTPIF